MRRREFITLFCRPRSSNDPSDKFIGAFRFACALAAVLLIEAPFLAAQSEEVTHRVGLLLNRHLADGIDEMISEMRTLGHIEERNLVLDWRLVESAEQNATIAAELISNVLEDHLYFGGGDSALQAAADAPWPDRVLPRPGELHHVRVIVYHAVQREQAQNRLAQLRRSISQRAVRKLGYPVQAFCPGGSNEATEVYCPSLRGCCLASRRTRATG